MLSSLLKMQREFMLVLDIHVEESDTSQTLKHATNAVLGLTSEIGEVAQSLNFTRPRAIDEYNFVKTEILSELVDVLFYTLELYNILGVSQEEIIAQYHSKFCVNLTRFLVKSKRNGHIQEINAVASRVYSHFVKNIFDSEISRITFGDSEMIASNPIIYCIMNIYLEKFLSSDDLLDIEAWLKAKESRT